MTVSAHIAHMFTNSCTHYMHVPYVITASDVIQSINSCWLSDDVTLANVMHNLIMVSMKQTRKIIEAWKLADFWQIKNILNILYNSDSHHHLRHQCNAYIVAISTTVWNSLETNESAEQHQG